MFFRKVTSKSNGKEYTYVKLIENYREGNKVKQRVVANLGNIDDLTHEKVQNLISGLTRICGMNQNLPTSLEAKRVLHFGDVLTIHKVWKNLGISEILDSLEPESKLSAQTALLTELMVLNQIIKPKNKQAISEWYKCLYLPGLENHNLKCDQFYDVLDTLHRNKENIENSMFKVMKANTPLDTGTVFCHLIRSKFEGQNGFSDDSKARNFLRHLSERKQVDMGVLVSKEGIPIGHRVFLGNFADGETVPRRITEIQSQYGIPNCIFVGDQNIITSENMQLLVAFNQKYIVGLEIRYSHETDLLKDELLKPIQTYNKLHDDLYYKEITQGNSRYILCYNPLRALQKQTTLENRLLSVETELQGIQEWIKENCSENTKVNFYKASSVLKNFYCKRYFECHYDEKTNDFLYHRRHDVIAREINLYGKFIIKTNCHELKPDEIIETYNRHTEMREEFRIIKSFDLRSNETYTESRIKGHVFICVLAYLVEKAMDMMLLKHGLKLSTKKALELVEDVKLTVSNINHSEVKSITEVMNTQKNIFAAVGLKKIPRILERDMIL